MYEQLQLKKKTRDYPQLILNIIHILYSAIVLGELHSHEQKPRGIIWFQVSYTRAIGNVKVNSAAHWAKEINERGCSSLEETWNAF